MNKISKRKLDKVEKSWIAYKKYIKDFNKLDKKLKKDIVCYILKEESRSSVAIEKEFVV